MNQLHEVPSRVLELAQQTHVAANALSNRITAFEEYLGKLPGRVETAFLLPKTDPSGLAGLRLHRVAKKWALSYASGKAEEHPARGSNEAVSELSWAPLMDASVRIKIASVAYLPTLMEAIVQEQDKVRKRILDAVTEFDEWAVPLGITTEEPGNK